jgi:nucleoside-diphosphate-sugar epimerase
MTLIKPDSGKLPESIMIFGCGYLGTAVARYFLGAGARVGALTRNAQIADKLGALGVSEVIKAELDAPGWIDDIKGEYQVVLNCVSSAGGGVAGYRKSYVEGMRQILNWVREVPVERFLYTSSTSVYPQDGGVWVDESADLAGASQTGSLLAESERLIEADAALFDAWYVFRLSGIYGPGRHYLLKQLREGDGVIPGRGDYFMNMIHLDDIVQAIVCAAAGTAASGIYNLSDGAPEKKEIVLAYLAKQLDFPVPRFAPDQISPRLKRRGGRMPDRRIANRKAREVLGWSPSYPSFKEGYASILAGD